VPTLGHFPLSQESNVIATNKSSNIGVDTLSTSYLFLILSALFTSCRCCFLNQLWSLHVSFLSRMHLLLRQIFPLSGKSHFFWILVFVLTASLYLLSSYNQHKNMSHPCIYYLLIISTKICLQCKSYLWFNVSCRGVPCLTYFSVVTYRKQGLLCNLS